MHYVPWVFHVNPFAQAIFPILETQSTPLKKFPWGQDVVPVHWQTPFTFEYP
jgi:hypothetical protein